MPDSNPDDHGRSKTPAEDAASAERPPIAAEPHPRRRFFTVHTHGERLAWRSPAAWATLLIVFVAGLALDLGSKSMAFAHNGPAPIVLDREALLADATYDPTRYAITRAIGPGDILGFRTVINRGAVFGIGANRRVALITFTFGALSIALLIFAFRTTERSHLAHTAVAMICAGGIGNLYDRLTFGVVRDFLQLMPGRKLPDGKTWGGHNPDLLPWVFNLADLWLLFGAILLLIEVNRAESKRQRAIRALQAANASG